MDEIWKPVVGYEGLYEVSNFGMVRSLRRNIRIIKKNGISYIQKKQGNIQKNIDKEKRNQFDSFFFHKYHKYINT